MGVIGAILGDIAGSQYEFPGMRPIDLDWKTCELFTEDCFFTDDSILTIATKMAIQQNKDFKSMYLKYGREYPSGYGPRFNQWLQSSNPQPYSSYGNGSAMRVAFVGQISNSEKEVQNLATESALCTHNHPEGIKGAVVTAMCIYMSKNGASKKEIEKYVKKQYCDTKYPYHITDELDDIRNNYKWDVTCQGCIPVAVKCFIDSDSYESCIRNVFSLPCDMDTVGCIAGSIAEEYYKTTGLDNEKILRKYLLPSLFKDVEDLLIK